MTKRRKELRFQKHIISSYSNQGGYAVKIANEWVAGLPDLVCSMPGFGVHLIELKHKPEMNRDKLIHYDNPMTLKQQFVAKKFIEAGGTIYLGIIAGSSDARGSLFGLFRPLLDQIITPRSGWSEYQLGSGFNIRKLLEEIQR